MQTLLFIGFEPYTPKMYPHTFDVLSLLHKHFKVTYYGGDDRGYYNYLLDKQTATWSKMFVNKEKNDIYKKITQIETDIKKLLDNDYDIIIATEHRALNTVCKYIKAKKSKLFFWSHDIITPDHFWFLESKHIRNLIAENKKNVSKLRGIIIQDHARAAVLDSCIFSHSVPKIYLPISLFPNKTIPTQKQESTRLLTQSIKLIQVGSINEKRFSNQIQDWIKKTADNISITFIGHIGIERHEHPKINYFNIQESFETMRNIIANHDIGIVGLNENNLNNHFYSKAAGQMVELLRLGIPIISIGHEELNEFVENHHIGKGIMNVSLLPNAINDLMNSYDIYNKNANAIFSLFFNLNNYEHSFISFLKSINS